MSQQIHTNQAPEFPLPFSQALQAGDFVYVSGQVGVNPATHEVVGDTIEEQAVQCLIGSYLVEIDAIAYAVTRRGESE